MLDIRVLFTREAIIARLLALPPILTPARDSVFTDRPNHPLPLVGKDFILSVANALPLVRRGAASVAAGPPAGTVDFYEPLPVRPNVSVTGAELNNLQLLDGRGMEAWAIEKTDFLRRRVRATTEALCALATSGKITYPVQLEGGAFEDWFIDFGNILSVTPSKLWSAADASMKDVMRLLVNMRKKIQMAGFASGALEIWAGEDAFNTLFGLAEALKSTAQIRVEITGEGIQVGTFTVKLRSEQWVNPQTKAMTPYVPAKNVRMIAKDAGHRLPYCALDDLDAKLLAMPIFIKPIVTKDPSGYKLVAESKPFPVVNVNGICEATVLS